MSVFNMFCVSFSALSGGETLHAPVPASLPRDRVFLLFFPLRGFPVPILPLCLSEVRCATTCSINLPPRLVFFRVFAPLECSVPSPSVG